MIKLTPKVEEVVELASQGYTNRAIAERLGKSIPTIKSQIMKGLQQAGMEHCPGMKTRVKLIKWYLTEYKK